MREPKICNGRKVIEITKTEYFIDSNSKETEHEVKKSRLIVSDAFANELKKTTKKENFKDLGTAVMIEEKNTQGSGNRFIFKGESELDALETGGKDVNEGESKATIEPAKTVELTPKVKVTQ